MSNFIYSDNLLNKITTNSKSPTGRIAILGLYLVEVASKFDVPKEFNMWMDVLLTLFENINVRIGSGRVGLNIIVYNKIPYTFRINSEYTDDGPNLMKNNMFVTKLEPLNLECISCATGSDNIYYVTENNVLICEQWNYTRTVIEKNISQTTDTHILHTSGLLVRNLYPKLTIDSVSHIFTDGYIKNNEWFDIDGGKEFIDETCAMNSMQRYNIPNDIKYDTICVNDKDWKWSIDPLVRHLSVNNNFLIELTTFKQLRIYCITKTNFSLNSVRGYTFEWSPEEGPMEFEW